MKKIFGLLLPIAFLGSSLAAYTGTPADDALINSLGPRIDALVAKDSTRAMTIGKKLEVLLPRLDDTTRTHYVLKGMYTYISMLLDEQNGASATATVAGSYQDYDVDDMAQALAMNADVVLFFHATWCPTCHAVNQTLLEQEEDLVDNIAVFKVDYDDQELSRSYGVTKQHTFVVLDENGDVVDRKFGVNTISQINKLVD